MIKDTAVKNSIVYIFGFSFVNYNVFDYKKDIIHFKKSFKPRNLSFEKEDFCKDLFNLQSSAKREMNRGY